MRGVGGSSWATEVFLLVLQIRALFILLSQDLSFVFPFLINSQLNILSNAISIMGHVSTEIYQSGVFKTSIKRPPHQQDNAGGREE